MILLREDLNVRIVQISVKLWKSFRMGKKSPVGVAVVESEINSSEKTASVF